MPTSADLREGLWLEFVWRYCNSREMGFLTRWEFHEQGWKLVCTADPGNGRVRNGSDVLAVFNPSPLDKKSWARFRFLKGSETGTFGERWSILAVATAMAILGWQKSVDSWLHWTPTVEDLVKIDPSINRSDGPRATNVRDELEQRLSEVNRRESLVRAHELELERKEREARERHY